MREQKHKPRKDRTNVKSMKCKHKGGYTVNSDGGISCKGCGKPLPDTKKGKAMKRVKRLNRVRIRTSKKMPSKRRL